MVKTREYRCETNPNVLCETFSTIKANLLQKETGLIYEDSVVDVIEGYDEHGNPFSRYTYEEVGVNPEEATVEDYENALERFGASV